MNGNKYKGVDSGFNQIVKFLQIFASMSLTIIFGISYMFMPLIPICPINIHYNWCRDHNTSSVFVITN